MSLPLITLDTDWAPDFVIDWVASRLIETKFRATWFVTHRSPAISRLAGRPDLFELGIHPNFLPGSSHGATPAEVLRHCMELVPGATSMRTHSLVQSTPIFAAVLAETPIRADASLYLPRAKSPEPSFLWWAGRRLVRIPYVWEDDLEAEWPDPRWSSQDLLRDDAGVVILDFHPIHVYMNSFDMSAYTELKRRTPRLKDATEGDVTPFVRQGPGPRTLFEELIAPGTRRGDGEWIRALAERLSHETGSPSAPILR